MPTNTEERPRVYLNKVHLKGFKSIEDVTIDFQKGLNILIGKNGAGKSNLLEFINTALSPMRQSRLPFRFSKLEFKSIDDHEFVLEIEREVMPKVENSNPHERISFSELFSIDGEKVFDSSGDSTRFKYGGRKIIYHNIYNVFARLEYHYSRNLYIEFDLPPNLGCIDSAGSIKIVEDEDGFRDWDFPITLRFLENAFWNLSFGFNVDSMDKVALTSITPSDITERLKLSENIIYSLKQYTPIEDVRFNKNINIYNQENTLIVDNLKVEFKVNGNWLPWSQLSDGTRRLFYIIAEITHTTGLVLLEEPELGVHPHQFHLLMNFLKEQSEEKQIIISTHAPKALDHLNLDELNSILLVNYDQKNGTQLRHLTDDEQAKAQEYANEVGYVSDYWMYSDLEE